MSLTKKALLPERKVLGGGEQREQRVSVYRREDEEAANGQLMST
jgi:hypothetical protein